MESKLKSLGTINSTGKISYPLQMASGSAVSWGVGYLPEGCFFGFGHSVSDTFLSSCQRIFNNLLKNLQDSGAWLNTKGQHFDINLEEFLKRIH
jgi:hypothetical protein